LKGKYGFIILKILGVTYGDHCGSRKHISPLPMTHFSKIKPSTLVQSFFRSSKTIIGRPVFLENYLKVLSLISYGTPCKSQVSPGVFHPLEKNLPVKEKHYLFSISHWLLFYLMKKHLMKDVGHSIYSIVYIVTLFRHGPFKKMPRRPFQGTIVRTTLQSYTVWPR
jgi:hypothetical protein